MAQRARRGRLKWGHLQTPAAVFRHIRLPRCPVGRTFEFAFRDRKGRHHVISGTIMGYEMEFPVLGTSPMDDAPELMLTMNGVPHLEDHPPIVYLRHTGFFRGAKGDDTDWSIVFDDIVERNTKGFVWSKIYSGHLSIVDER